MVVITECFSANHDYLVLLAHAGEAFTVTFFAQFFLNIAVSIIIDFFFLARFRCGELLPR